LSEDVRLGEKMKEIMDALSKSEKRVWLRDLYRKNFDLSPVYFRASKLLEKIGFVKVGFEDGFNFVELLN